MSTGAIRSLDDAEQVPLFDVGPKRDGQPKDLIKLTLRDKPLGYGIGDMAGAPCAVSVCPKCKEHGARISENIILHTVNIYEKNGRTKLDRKTDACVLDAYLASKNPWRP